MSEAKDQGIKLFGRTIPVPEKSPSLASCGSSVDDSTDPDRACWTNSSPEEDKNGDGEDRATEKPTSTVEDNGSAPVNSEESLNPEASSMVSENPKTPSVEKESSTPKTSKTEEEQNSDPSNSTTSQEKPLKKPDKIIPCPRCNSMDTKFCYYNNYNVNQPRHFCKNCQRYWTAGGTMRNVPVGAGRRKNKNSASSHYRHITVSETLQNGHTDVVPSSAHHPALRTNGTVLTFGSDAPLCESMASVLNIADKSMRNGIKNGFQKPEELRIQLTTNNHSNVSSAAAVSNSKDETEKAVAQEPVLQNCQNFPPQIQCFPGGPWPYTWNSPQLNPPLSPHGFYPPPSGFPMPFYPAPAAYWGTWNIPWIPQLSSPKTPTSGPNSPTLGKHSRDGSTITAQEEETQKETNPKKYLWVPKTLRIDDPGDAAKSSIWTTLGIKNDKADSGLFKAFQPKGDEKRHLEETSPVLQANPAALSRSRNFHENS